MIANDCRPPVSERPAIPLDAWPRPSPRRQFLHVPRWLPLPFRSGYFCRGGHFHGQEGIAIHGDTPTLVWAEPVGPYLIAVTGAIPYAVSLIVDRSGRVQRRVEMPEDPTSADRDEPWIQARTRAVATAELAVLTLQERRAPGRRSRGEAWLRAQLEALFSPDAGVGGPP